MSTCARKNISSEDMKDHESVNKNNGSIQLKNPHIERMDQDYLYHLALGTATHDLVEMFKDVKFVCMGGAAKRMEDFAHYVMNEIDYKLPVGTTLLDLTQKSQRFSMYKVGPVLSVNHGIGVPSMGTLLHEVVKLMYHAKVVDPVFIRIGTSGGIGVEAGTVVITEDGVDAMLNPYYQLPILGKMVQRPAKLDKKLTQELKAMVKQEDSFKVVCGKTMHADDFYEGQGRLDGAFCDYTEKDKIDYLRRLQKAGVVNIEMEASAFAAFTYHAGIRAAIVCVTFLDRLKGDQVTTPKTVLEEWQKRPQIIVARYIKKSLQNKDFKGF
ncbi:uridine phosphorylase 1-like [Chelonus insularis]|uniref:uridine phosphorylase 1-like n=1 Tax=Chelonus insularis TaxID=460826 RepID=UPI001588EA2A|nr:uridine phosphorylase 1-like [Chelonus insularis]